MFLAVSGGHQLLVSTNDREAAYNVKGGYICIPLIIANFHNIARSLSAASFPCHCPTRELVSDPVAEAVVELEWARVAEVVAELEWARVAEAEVELEWALVVVGLESARVVVGLELALPLRNLLRNKYFP